MGSYGDGFTSERAGVMVGVGRLACGPEHPTHMKQEPRPGDGIPVPRQPAKDSRTRTERIASRTQEKTPELHHILPASKQRKRS